MKLVIVGGTGLIGSRLVARLCAHGHDAVPASPATGVDTVTGRGLADVLRGASAVVDASNARSFDDTAVMDFFTTSTRQLVAAAGAAGVAHYVALSVVGAERLSDSGYFRAKTAQERLIRESSVPYSIVRATQFYEFVAQIAAAATVGRAVRVPPVFVQPMAAEEVAAAVGRIALGPPANGIVEVAGPEAFSLDALVREDLTARQDPREVIADPQARYFGALLGSRTLMPASGARLGAVSFREWVRQSVLRG